MARRGQLPFLSGFSDERIPKLIGVFFIFVAIYLTIAFTSYLFTWQIDQDSVLRFSWGLLLQGEVEMANWLGRLGAIVSNMFFYWGFGLPSFIVVYLLWIYGVALIKGDLLEALKPQLRFSILFLVFGSIFLQFLFYTTEFPWGGAFGQTICQWLLNFVGIVGVVFLFLLLLFVVITWSYNPNYRELTAQKAVQDTKGWFSDTFNRRYTTQERKKYAATKRTADNAKSVDDGDSAMDTSNKANKTNTFSKVYNTVESIENESEFAKKEVKPLETIRPANSAKEDDSFYAEGGIQLAFDKDGKTITSPYHANNAKNAGADFEINENITPEPIADPILPKSPTLAEIEARKKGNSHIDLSTPYDPTLELSTYESPVLMLLDDYSDQKMEVDRAELEANKDQIIATLLNYKIEIVKIRATIGPTVTLYEIVPAPGVRISKIKSLEDDIALSLAALGIRIIAPIPGKGTIGIEVPNKNKQVVSLREVLQSERFKRSDMDLPIALGKTIQNEVFVADLTKMPHLLIAGATGQGKSVGINAILMSLLYKKHPSQVKIVMVDPKKVELFPYAALESHFLAFLPDQEEPIITDTAKVVNTLNSLCIEMDERYDLLKKASARNIKEYNEKFISRHLNPEKGHRFLPFIVLIIDEFADLIMTAGKEVELPIGRLAQLSRAVGIHLIIATQRPSVNIITGVIKANFPARLAFKVSSKVDSRTILDHGGAEQLIGRGDMLLSIGGDTVRLQCAFVDTPEVERVIKFVSDQPGYPEPFHLPEFRGDDADNMGNNSKTLSLDELDDMIEDAARLVVQNQHGSTSMIQRRLKLGYNRAGRIMDQLQALGIVGPAEGSKPREVLFFDEAELISFMANLKKR